MNVSDAEVNAVGIKPAAPATPKSVIASVLAVTMIDKEAALGGIITRRGIGAPVHTKERFPEPSIVEKLRQVGFPPSS